MASRAGTPTPWTIPLQATRVLLARAPTTLLLHRRAGLTRPNAVSHRWASVEPAPTGRLVMLSDRSSAPTLLGCRPSARNSLGRSQKRFQLLTKRIFCSLHHENNHSFKANSLLNFSCPRRYVGRGPDTMIVAAGDVLRTISIRLLKSLFSVSVCRSLVSLAPAWITTAATLSSSFRIAGICTETSRTWAPGRQWVCTLPSANVARTCRTIESPMTTASRSVSQRGAKRFRDEMSKTGGGEVVDRGPGSRLPLLHPGSVVSRRRNVKAICDDRVPGARGLCRETHGVEVVGVLAARCILTPDLWASARDVSSVAFCFLSWACFPSSSWTRLSTASSSSCTECSVLTCTQR